MNATDTHKEGLYRMAETLGDVSSEFDALIKASMPFGSDSLIDGQNPEDLQVDDLIDEFQQESASSEEADKGNVIPFGVNIGRKVTELIIDIDRSNPDPHITPITPGGSTKRTEYLSRWSDGSTETDIKNDDPA
jgi:hypothetical protein